VDQYMDGYGDSITIGCLGKIAFYRFLFSFPCGSEIKMCVMKWKVCVCSSHHVYDDLSMNESIECVSAKLSTCYRRV